MAVSPDGDTLATCGHRSSVLSVAFSPDGHLIATCDHQGSIKIWDGGPRAEPHKPGAPTPKAEKLP